MRARLPVGRHKVSSVVHVPAPRSPYGLVARGAEKIPGPAVSYLMGGIPGFAPVFSAQSGNRVEPGSRDSVFKCIHRVFTGRDETGWEPGNDGP